MMNRCIYLFCWLCLACWSKPVSAEGQALLVIPEPGEENLDSLRLVCPESE